VLALRALGVGDLLTAVPALRALARAFPRHERVLAAPAALAPLVALIGPDPGRVPQPSERVVGRLQRVPAWVGRDAVPDPSAGIALPWRPSVAVNLHGRGPQSHRLLLATAPERLIAFAHDDPTGSRGDRLDGPAWDAGEHEVQRWCRLLSEHGIAADPRELDLPAPPDVDVDTGDGPVTLLHPGAASAARRWPLERWAAVARAERAARRTVVVSGSPAEQPLAQRVADEAGLSPRTVAAGRTDLRELAALVAGAERVVCGDTGVAHLATALGTPSVVLFGPASPAAWGPPPERPWHRVLWSGRSGDPHAVATDPGLLEISVAEVLQALGELPSPSSASSA
jgi:ADP-heptose:LPS heptosyltransferase